MRGALPEKWIEGEAADDRPRDVAARTLQNRLGAVLQLLPLAAEKAGEDSDYIHELRVWTRRATAALALYEELMPRRRFAWMKKQLKRVRRAAKDARDCDVLLERLRHKQSTRGAKRWLEAVRAEREEAQKVVVAAHERLGRGHRFARRIDKLLQRVRSRGEETAGAESTRFGDWARERLRPLVEQFFGAIPSDPTDEAALHRLRVRGKELRYAMELLAGAFPDEFRTGLYPTIEAIQDRLGDINDLATAKARLQQKLEAVTGAAEAASWRRLLASEEAQLGQARQAFWDWCTPQRLAAGGRELLGGGPARPGRAAGAQAPPQGLPAPAQAAAPSPNVPLCEDIELQEVPFDLRPLPSWLPRWITCALSSPTMWRTPCAKPSGNQYRRSSQAFFSSIHPPAGTSGPSSLS
jgi:CHAD domain-containing protein